MSHGNHWSVGPAALAATALSLDRRMGEVASLDACKGIRVQQPQPSYSESVIIANGFCIEFIQELTGKEF